MDDIISGKFSPIHRCFVLPFNTFADVEDNSQWVGSVPALSQMRRIGKFRLVVGSEGKYVPIYCPVQESQRLYNATNQCWEMEEKGVSIVWLGIAP